MRVNASGWVLSACVAVMMSGCGGFQASKAAIACEESAKQNVKDKEISIDLGALAESVKAQEDGTYNLSAPITFDLGLSTEYTQVLDCRVQNTADGPRVIRVTFVF